MNKNIEYSKLVNITFFVKNKERREIISEFIKNGFVEHDIEKNIYRKTINSGLKILEVKIK